jgi:hypothetical protein
VSNLSGSDFSESNFSEPAEATSAK